MSDTSLQFADFALPTRAKAGTAARAARLRIDWNKQAGHLADVRDAAGAAIVIGLAVLPAVGAAAIFLSAFGWSVL